MPGSESKRLLCPVGTPSWACGPGRAVLRLPGPWASSRTGFPVGRRPPGLHGFLAQRLVGGLTTAVGVLPAHPPTVFTGWDVDPCPRCGSHAPTVTCRQPCSPPRRSQALPSVEGPGCGRDDVSRTVGVAPPPGHGADREPAAGAEDEKSGGGRPVRGQGLRAPRLPGLHAGMAGPLWPPVDPSVFSLRVADPGTLPAPSVLFPARPAVPHGPSSAPPAAPSPSATCSSAVMLCPEFTPLAAYASPTQPTPPCSPEQVSHLSPSPGVVAAAE